MLGQIIFHDGKNYEILKLLGKGKGGYSYLAKSADGLFVFKKMHYEPCDTYQFEDNKLASELRDYNTLKQVGIPLPELYYYNMDEQYLIKEYIEGDILAEIVGKNMLTDEHIKQIFNMCSLLYPNNLNIDYFPTNFVARNNKLYYIDYECNSYMDEWNFENWGIYFLANSAGMKKFIETGDHNYLSQNAKPYKDGFEEIVAHWKNIVDNC